MTFKEFKEFYKKFHRAQVLMLLGYLVGVLIAIFLHLHHTELYGLLTGLLFSIHRYRQGFCEFIDEEIKRIKGE